MYIHIITFLDVKIKLRELYCSKFLLVACYHQYKA